MSRPPYQHYGPAGGARPMYPGGYGTAHAPFVPQVHGARPPGAPWAQQPMHHPPQSLHQQYAQYYQQAAAPGQGMGLPARALPPGYGGWSAGMAVAQPGVQYHPGSAVATAPGAMGAQVPVRSWANVVTSSLPGPGGSSAGAGAGAAAPTGAAAPVPAEWAIAQSRLAAAEAATSSGFRSGQGPAPPAPPPPPPARAPPRPPPQPPAPHVASATWPPSLKRYIADTFARCATPQQRDLAERKIRSLTVQALKSGVLWSRDWSNWPAVSLSEASAGANGSGEPQNKRARTSAPAGMMGQPVHGAPPVAGFPPSPYTPRPRPPWMGLLGHPRPPPPPPGVATSANMTPLGAGPDVMGLKRGARAKRGRMSKAEKKQGKKQAKKQSKKQSEESSAAEQLRAAEEAAERRQRFLEADGGDGQQAVGVDLAALDREARDAGSVVGRCLVLEKRYFRLTETADPELVRPLPVLQQALPHVLGKYRESGDYKYLCSQLKSMRQDVTIQRLQNEFVVELYQTHARIALEHGDVNEFHQCQTQLFPLHARGLGSTPSHREFLAYRLLYYVYTRNATETPRVIASLTAAEREDPVIQHALDFRQCVVRHNYVKLAKLAHTAPNAGRYLVERIMELTRPHALLGVARALRPTVDREWLLTRILGFNDLEEGDAFLASFGAVLDEAGKAMVSAKSAPHIAAKCKDLSYKLI